MRSFEFLTRAIFIVIGGALILFACGLIIFAVAQLFPVVAGEGSDIGATLLTSIGRFWLSRVVETSMPSSGDVPVVTRRKGLR